MLSAGHTSVLDLGIFVVVVDKNWDDLVEKELQPRRKRLKTQNPLNTPKGIEESNDSC